MKIANRTERILEDCLFSGNTRQYGTRSFRSFLGEACSYEETTREHIGDTSLSKADVADRRWDVCHALMQDHIMKILDTFRQASSEMKC